MSRKRKTHGFSGTRIYIIWQGMLARCLNEKCKGFARYGGRGIKVCERWLDVSKFAADMGERPAGKTLDRVDNDGDYEPDNCRWSTQAEQQRNRSNNRRITACGKTMVLEDWAKEIGLTASCISIRLTRLGWSEEDALSKPMSRARGDRVNTSKLDETRARSIRSDRASGMSLPKLAAKYAVSVQSVWQICNRKAWAHIQ